MTKRIHKLILSTSGNDDENPFTVLEFYAGEYLSAVQTEASQ